MTNKQQSLNLEVVEKAENKMTIKQAVTIASSPESLAVLDLEQIEGLIAVLETSGDRKVTRKIDMVKGELEKRRKEVKGTPAEKEIKAVENSVKKIIPKVNGTVKPKTETGTKTTVKPKVQPKANGTKTQPKSTTKVKPKQQPEKEETKFEFPAETPDGMKRVEFKTVKDLQKALLENPYKIRLFMLEKGMKDLTAFLVTYANDEVMVLLDLSREINTVAPIDMTTYKDGSVTFDGVVCPVGFYLAK